jgi:hypothetical protein
MLETETIQVPNAVVVFGRGDGAAAPQAGAWSLFYTGGQFGAELLPLRVTCRAPAPGDLEYALEWLLPGEYRFEQVAESGRRSTEFRLRAGEVLRLPWPFTDD